MDLTRYRTRDLLRSIGGLLFASGAVVLEIRKSATWGLGGRMLVVLIPAVLLYGLGLEAAWRRKRGPRVDAEPWQSVVVVFAVFLNAIWLTLLFRWVGAHGALVAIPALGLTAASAAYAAWRANVRFAALLAALDIVVAWLALWNKLLHPPPDTTRWLLLIVGVGLVATAVTLARRGRREASELVTAAGAAAVLAASAGVFVDLVGFSLNRVVRAVGLAHSVGGLNVKQQFVWDLLLLLIAVGLIAYGSRARVRGRGTSARPGCSCSCSAPAFRSARGSRGAPERCGDGLAARAARDRRDPPRARLPRPAAGRGARRARAAGREPTGNTT